MIWFGGNGWREATAGHAHGLENEIVHEGVERAACDLLHKELQEYKSTA